MKNQSRGFFQRKKKKCTTNRQTVFEPGILEARLKVKILSKHVPARSVIVLLKNARPTRLEIGLSDPLVLTVTEKVVEKRIVPKMLKNLPIGSVIYVHHHRVKMNPFNREKERFRTIQLSKDPGAQTYEIAAKCIEW